MTDTISIGEHGACDIIEEHGQEWAVCNNCGAQWGLHGADTELVSEGDGTCLDDCES